jgi:hypothetical protein
MVAMRECARAVSPMTSPLTLHVARSRIVRAPWEAGGSSGRGVQRERAGALWAVAVGLL